MSLCPPSHPWQKHQGKIFGDTHPSQLAPKKSSGQIAPAWLVIQDVPNQLSSGKTVHHHRWECSRKASALPLKHFSAKSAAVQKLPHWVKASSCKSWELNFLSHKFRKFKETAQMGTFYKILIFLVVEGKPASGPRWFQELDKGDWSQWSANTKHRRKPFWKQTKQILLLSFSFLNSM